MKRELWIVASDLDDAYDTIANANDVELTESDARSNAKEQIALPFKITIEAI